MREVERYNLGTLMVKYVLSKSTVHENQLKEIQLIAGDNEILSKTVNQNIIRKYPKIFIKIKKIKNTKITHIYSAQSIELGDTVPCNVYHSKIGKKKPTNFYYIPQNSLHHIKIEKLIKKIDSESTKTGEIKITSGKICFHALGKTQNKDSGHIGRQTKFIDSLSKSFKKWNNSFTFAVEKGIYEIFEYDFHYNDDAELKCLDTMFSVKKIP